MWRLVLQWLLLDSLFFALNLLFLFLGLGFLPLCMLSCPTPGTTVCV